MGLTTTLHMTLTRLQEFEALVTLTAALVSVDLA
jgi:hypothetical protein